MTRMVFSGKCWSLSKRLFFFFWKRTQAFDWFVFIQKKWSGVNFICWELVIASAADSTTMDKNGTFPSKRNWSEPRAKERLGNSFQVIISVCLNALLWGLLFQLYTERVWRRSWASIITTMKKTKGHITLFKTKCLEVSEDRQVKNQHRTQDLLSGLRVFF